VAISDTRNAFRTSIAARRARSDPPSLKVMPHETRRKVAHNLLAASLRPALGFERSPRAAASFGAAAACTKTERSEA